MEIEQFLNQIQAHPEYNQNPKMRSLVNEYRDKLLCVGMFCGDKAINDAETLAILKEFKGRLKEIIANIPGNEPAIERKLSPEAQNRILAIVKARFELHNQDQVFATLRGDLDWTAIQARLEANPEKIWSLNEMERTGGEPDVIGYDAETQSFTVFDCSAQSPSGRRNLCYDRTAQDEAEKAGHGPKGNAVDMAKAMGIEIINTWQYQYQLSELGKFDTESSSWIKTPHDIRIKEVALAGNRFLTFSIHVDEVPANQYSDKRGFRGLLRI